jgi:hypothetical protein
LKTFQPILDVPKTLSPFQEGWSVAHELKFVVIPLHLKLTLNLIMDLLF